MIKNIRVVDFYHTVAEFNVNFNEKVNIIVGDNGTYKTKLLNLINSIFNGRNLEELFVGYFKEFHLELNHDIDKLWDSLKIKRFEGKSGTKFKAEFEISWSKDPHKKTFKETVTYISTSSREVGSVRTANMFKYYTVGDYTELQKILITPGTCLHYLPVNAYNSYSIQYDEKTSISKMNNDAIIRNISLSEFRTRFFAQQLNKDLLTLIFTGNDKINDEEAISIKINEREITSLIKVLEKVGLSDDNLVELIVCKLRSEIDTNSADYKISDTMIKQLIKLLRKMNKDLTQAWAWRDRLEEILNNLFSYTDYHFLFDREKGLIITRDIGETTIQMSIDDMSSGEKQLIGYFCTLIFSEYNMILVDEPENSLHIEWQEDLIENLLKANPKTQYILATHSNHLLKKYIFKDYMSIIDMNRIIRGE